ncbi:MAG: S1 RNA-binding domain-containing protein [Anaerolineae bacterium]|nr:S1 RNA-binding domain-containing protein [Anaerolineae bacterium]MDH7473594.1 S1 RNA-binding domain-containing protein [Anaerolineae bacterium]
MTSEYEHPASIDDLTPKMKLRGTVTRVELAGAFVDIGVGRDGFVHISEISPERVNRVADVLSPGDEITVWVKAVDAERGRISLTMIEPPARTLADLKPDMVLTGTVTKLMPYGAFVDIGVGRDGLVHISEMSTGYVKHPSEVVEEGGEVLVRVISVNQRKGQIQLSMKGLPTDEVEEEEDEEALPTVMELALKEAVAGRKSKSKARQKKHRRHPEREELDEILSRTLRLR